MPKHWLPWHAGGCVPSSPTCAWPWMDACTPIIAFCFSASWLILTFWISPSLTLSRKSSSVYTPLRKRWSWYRPLPGCKPPLLQESGRDWDGYDALSDLDKHLASWAGVCPGNKQSAGKRLSGKTTQGNTHLQALLGEAAWAAARTKGTYLSAFYHRIARRRGKKKAIVAQEHKLLVIIYHVLLTKKPYSDLGADYFDQREKTRLERHHIQRL